MVVIIFSYRTAIINPEPLSSQREAPPSYNDLFPGVKDVREQVQRAREGDGGERVAGTVAICDLLCKSGELIVTIWLEYPLTP